jgi:FtsZ-interacting cell division protein ZipA
MPSWAIVVIIAVVVAAAVIAWWMMSKRRTQHLRTRFGPEYDRLLKEEGDRRRAEEELLRREKRVQKLDIRSLEPHQRDRFAQAWHADQARFVDDPKGAVMEADRLVTQVMKARGYPVGDFEQRMGDISVDHSRVVENYRAAYVIAQRQKRGEASTEDLRKAMVYYRELFDDLLEMQEVRR